MENKSLLDFIRVAIMSIGTALDSLRTEMDGTMWTLIVFISIDYITGVIDSLCSKQLSSRIGYKGILKKATILCVVAISSLIGTYIFESEALKTAVALYYISNEGISILENCANIGIPIPKVLKNAILKTGDDSDKTF